MRRRGLGGWSHWLSCPVLYHLSGQRGTFDSGIGQSPESRLAAGSQQILTGKPTVWSRFQRGCPSRGVKDVETPRAGPGMHRAPENFCSGQLCPSTRWGNRVPERAAPGARTSRASVVCPRALRLSPGILLAPAPPQPSGSPVPPAWIPGRGWPRQDTNLASFPAPHLSHGTHLGSLRRGGLAPPSALTADGFQIFCFTFAGKWSPELWFGSPHGKSTLPFGRRPCGLTGCLLASGASFPGQ